MTDANEQFDDPALKQALRRAIPAMTCPQALRDRIQQAADDIASESLRLPMTSATAPRSAARFLRAHRLAIAASILGLAGGMALFRYAGDDTAEFPGTDASALQPVAYSLATQDAALSGDPTQIQHHAPALSQDNLVAANQSLQRQTGQSLPLGALAAAGWEFHGVDDCRLGNFRGTHLVFLRPKQNISVFILPAQAAGNLADGRLYTMTTGRKPVAAAVRGPWLICLVGASTDGSLTADHLGNLLTQIIPSR